MAARLPRPTGGIPTKKTSMRPPSARPSSARLQSTTAPPFGHSRSGTTSPTNSVASISTNVSRAKSPGHVSGVKRKERDADDDGGHETNIHVVVRCRGRSDREVRENSGVVVSTNGVKGNSVELSMGPSALSNKTYHFDKVFAPAADQAMIYDDVVTPILDEMLAGYNCTIFAYGQTGTGKTYTMSGDMSDTLGLLSDSAGIIPRVLHSLFTKLESDEAESSVKCSFIELYNEELRDLLSIEENAKLKIYDDSNKKGHSATVVQGMEESHIKNASEGIKLLQDGSYRRQVAATKCNDLSSRSHTVFTVTVYTKRTTDTGEDFVSAGKLNLVDLAGSENIQRSGAENKRAAEAGLINKSLLTLGRVINALVDKSSHIPYRESKLTRLLQDSLGGRTKTCIIATVSPAKSNLEETISTLDYAFRAKNIRNKPQINQMISKKTLLKEFTAEIEKLKSELIATRHRNGVYLTNESYEELTTESESRRILTEEQKAKIETMETNLRNKVQELFSLTSNFNVLKKDNESTRTALEETQDVLQKTEIVLANTRQNLAEETVLRQAHQNTEEELSNIGTELISTLGRTVNDVDGLHSKLRRRSDLQALNRNAWTSSKTQVSDVTEILERRVEDLRVRQDKMISDLLSRVDTFVADELQGLKVSQSFLQDKMDAFAISEKEVNGQTEKSKDEMNEVLEEIKVLREEVKTKVGEGLNGLSAAAGRISAGVISELGAFHNQLHASYSGLGKDFKGIFEELIKHLNSQRTEAEQLRLQLIEASRAAMQANSDASTRLQTALEEEREQSSKDRQDLLSQMSNLINDNAQKQDTRMTAKVDAVKQELADSSSRFEEAQTKYGESMDVWDQKERLLVDEVLKSREVLKTKLKKDWQDATQHHSSIETTTKSVHEETVRIVDAQMKDMAVQMQALDEFVTRARSQNDEHHQTHVVSLNGLATTVNQSYTNIGSHFTTSFGRIQNHGSDMVAQINTVQSTLPSFTSDIKEPLSELRSNIISTSLTEYVPTGETPMKMQYQYPMDLPRTTTHDKLLAKLRNPVSASTSPAADSVNVSPSKGMIFTDATEDEVELIQADPVEQPASTGTFGLREIDVNVLNASTMSTTDSRVAPTQNGDGPPPLKRQNTNSEGMVSKLPSLQKIGSKSTSMVKLEGRENNLVPPGMLSQSLGRRLRSGRGSE